MSAEDRNTLPDIEDTFGFLTPAFFDNPYPFYRALHANDPVHWSDKTNSWLVTQYQDVAEGLRNPTFSSQRGSSHLALLDPSVQAELTQLSNFYNTWLMYMDEPDHGRIKRHINRPFGAEAVQKQASKVESKAMQLSDQLPHDRPFDLLSDFASPLAIYTMGELLGLPEADHHLIPEWSHDLVGFLGAKGDIEKGRAAQRTLSALEDYLDGFISEGSSESGLFSSLVQAEHAGYITRGELLATVANVLIDGHEPIANVISNGFLALIQNPEQLQILKDHPELLSKAIEEVVRIDPPFQYAARTALVDTELGGKKIQAGQRVQFMLGAANHDEMQFERPDEFNVTRNTSLNASFGFGIHFCPGARLGRTTVQIGIKTILQKFDHLSLVEKPIQWHHSLGYRGLKSLRMEAAIQ